MRGQQLPTGTDEDRALKPLYAPALAADGVRHGFFTRHGGVSTGIYAGLNGGIGSQDDPQAVRINRTRITDHLGVAADRLACPWQIHSAEAVLVDASFAGERPKADAVVTAVPGLAVGVVTADCGPVLFADVRAGVVAAAHAGWKGALGGVLESTVETMLRAGSVREDIQAVLGPSISQVSYEVGSEFVERFHDADAAYDEYFRAAERPGHALFDLQGFILGRLRAIGVNAGRIDACTYREEERFFSYRRSTHRGESDYGRQISAIAWVGN